MHETEQDLAELQELLERTLARANPHLTSIVSPERRLTARQVARYLQGTKHVAFATVNERGEPESHRSTACSSEDASRCRRARAARLRHLRANPACSAVHMDGDVVGITVHGRATIIGADDSGVGEIEPVWREIYGSSPFEWGEGVVFMRIEPTSMWHMPSTPIAFPASSVAGKVLTSRWRR